MNLLKFITENPDLVGLIGGLVAAGLGLKKRGATLRDTWDVLLQIGRQAMLKLLSDPQLTDDAYVRTQIRIALWSGLDRLGIKRTPIVEEYVDEAVEHVHGELADKVMAYQLGRLGKAGGKLEAAAGEIDAHLKATTP